MLKLTTVLIQTTVSSNIVQLSIQEDQTESQIVEVKLLGKMSQSYIRQLLGSHFPNHYGALSLDTLNNASMAFIKLGVVTKIKL